MTDPRLKEALEEYNNVNKFEYELDGKGGLKKLCKTKTIELRKEHEDKVRDALLKIISGEKELNLKVTHIHYAIQYKDISLFCV